MPLSCPAAFDSANKHTSTMVDSAVEKVLASDARWTSTSLREALPRVFAEYWSTEPGFSDATLTHIRNHSPEAHEVRYPDEEYFFAHILNHDPVDPTAALQYGFKHIHPLFQPGNFLTSLPMEEVYDQLLPALRLATMFVTNERALQWFAHIRFSEMADGPDGIKMLIRPVGNFTKEQMGTVRKDLVALADKCKFTWGSGGRFNKDSQGAITYGFCCNTVSSVVYTIHQATSEKPLDREGRKLLRPRALREFSPIVFLNIAWFHKALQHRHHGASRARQETDQFTLAGVILHEIGHVWMAFCHPKSMSKPEPLAFPCDAIPESGFSWEDFIFGANILSDSLTADVLRAQSFASVFRKPLHELSAHIPQKYISQWFLQSTWDDFAHLHASGKLYAPSPDRQTDQFCLRRFCKTTQRMALVFYVDGFRKASEACDLPLCSCSTNPGRTEPWPSKPEHLRRAYMKVLQEDCETAKAMGLDANFAYGSAYKTLCCAMDRADNPRGLPIEWPEPAAPPLCQGTEKCVCM